MKDNIQQRNEAQKHLSQSKPPIPKNLQHLSQWMDNSIVLPGGYRIGWDAIIGLLPGVGDFAGLVISLYIVAGAYRAGASLSVLLRMLLNIGIETVLGMVPIIGDLFDMVFKANMRNMQLLELQYADPNRLAAQSKYRIWLLILGGLLLIATTFYAVIGLLAAVLRMLF